MIGLAARLAGTMTAGFIVIVLAAAASVRALLEWTAPDVTDALLAKASGLGGWLFWKLVRVMGRIQAGERMDG